MSALDLGIVLTHLQGSAIKLYVSKF